MMFHICEFLSPQAWMINIHPPVVGVRDSVGVYFFNVNGIYFN